MDSDTPRGRCDVGRTSGSRGSRRSRVHGSRRRLRRAGSGFSPRGITLLVTVLLALIGASIALAILSQSLFVSREGASSAQSHAATQNLENAVGGFNAALSANPYFWQSEVFADPGDGVAERARVCTNGTDIEPGSAWPSSCGSTWSYAPATGSSLGETTVVQLTPPTLGSPFLTASFLAHANCPSGTLFSTLASCGSEVGETLTYRLGGAGSFSIFSAAGVLNLNAVAPNEPSGGSYSTTISGTVYSAGSIALGQSGAASSSGATFEAESGFLGTSTSATNVYATSGIAGCTTQPHVGTLGGQTLENIRCVQPAPLSGSGLTAGVTQGVEAACATSTSANVTVGTTTYASELCVRQGSTLVTSSGSSVTVPSSVNGYLLLPGADVGGSSPAANTVDIYTYTDSSGQTPGGSLPSAGNCVIACSLTSTSSGDVKAGTSLGTLSAWTLLGTFWLPESGVISTDADTVVGLCGKNFDTGGSCTSPSASEGGFTIIAGTPGAPRDLYVGGSTPTYPSAVAFEASGDIVFPYWDHAVATSLTNNVYSDPSAVFVDASLVALGGGHTNSSAAIVSDPATVPTAPSGTTNESALLDVVGSIEAANVNLGSLGLFANFAFSVPTALYSDPAPWFTGPSLAWSANGSTPLPASKYASLGG